MTWGWRPTGGPTAGDERRADEAISWVWTVALRDGARRRIEVRLGAALVAAAEGDLPTDLREAVATRGRSEITRVALWEQPPELIVVDLTGRERIGGLVATARPPEHEEG